MAWPAVPGPLPGSPRGSPAGWPPERRCRPGRAAPAAARRPAGSDHRLAPGALVLEVLRELRPELPRGLLPVPQPAAEEAVAVPRELLKRLQPMPWEPRGRHTPGVAGSSAGSHVPPLWLSVGPGFWFRTFSSDG